MRRKFVPVLALCALVTSNSVSRGQNGPDADPDGAPGYAQSVFDHGLPDSVNVYNGQLTVPIAIGPSYPVGPKLKFQAMLTYNSTVWEFGNPGPDDQSDLGLYQPIKADPSLGVGWSLTAGAIKPCGIAQASRCYVGPDGSERQFDQSPAANFFKTSEGSQLLLHDLGASAGYEMWDGDGNRYAFGWRVTGYDDLPQSYVYDLGRGRNGWYLTGLADPFGNTITLTYYSGLGAASPCWTPGHCPTANNSWILKNVKRGATTLVTVNLGTDPGAPGITDLVTSLDLAVSGGGTANWSLSRGTVAVTRGDPNTHSLALPTINAIKLPAAPALQYAFAWNAGGADSGYGGLLKVMTLPSGGVVSYVWGAYSFYHGRTASLSINCAPLGPPNDADVKQSGRPAAGVKTNGLEEAEISWPAIPGTDCSPQNPNRWRDTMKGVVRRTTTFARADGTLVDAVTDYAQYAFPFGERGSLGNDLGPQSLTLVTQPADRDGHRVAMATLFWGARKGTVGSGSPGDRVGADIRAATYDHDPYPGMILPFPQPLCGSAADALCVTHAARVAQRAYEYDIPPTEVGNRRLKTETTYYGPTASDDSCSGCANHVVAFSNSGADTWEGNGRHYGVETHSGSLGGDARTVTTDWASENWTTMPSPGEAVLPNLLNQRMESLASSVAERYFEFDTATGFLKGTFVYDAIKDVALINCRYPDGSGNLDKELTRTLASASAPPRTYCSATYGSFPTVGTDGDMFGKAYTHQNGQLLTTRWINGSISAATFNVRDFVRDAATGWITASRDTAGLATAYAYDALGRVTTVTPPAAAELKTRICYETANATTAYRASAQQSCPVPATNASVATWQHYDYDGLGRLVREQRLQPTSSVSKRFTLYDGAGHDYFQSEWVSSATSEAVAADVAATCAFAGGNAATGRPSGAPGTYRLCWDPFGRPQQIVGAKHSSLSVVARSDGAVPYSDTLEQVTAYCVNATFSALATPSCSSGAVNPVTTTRRDAFGRVTSVTEPSGEATTYGYDVNGKLLSVAQGDQSRSFGYDTTGLPRSEKTPEGGLVTYASVGSLGNVRQETRPGGAVARVFDFAGRMTEEDAGGSKYVINCYDGKATCADGSPGSGGGTFPSGRLTRRYGYNRIPTIGPIVDEQFEYGDAGGRLSKLVTTAGNGDLSASATQTWSYGTLGLVATHGHPRSTGSFSVAPAYVNGLATSVVASGASVVTAAAYAPSGALAAWSAGNTGAPVVTTIAPDATGLPRPGSISNSLWSSGAYVYDGAGNILKIGTSDAFTYDSRSRLLSAKYGSTTRAFGYDRYGNLTQNGAAIGIDPSTNRITSGGARYDGDGSMLSYGGDAMAYDALDRQYRNSNAGSDWVFLFNGAGERIAKFPAKSPVLRREMARYVAEANAMAKGWSLPPCAQVFTDVSCSDPDARHIQLVYARGITGGCATNPLQYCPDATLTRAQMAVFLVKSYKPDGFTPPACQGTFTDVTCSGPYATFAPWIEQLYRDGVTGGCSASPLQFCPANTVGEWETLVWLAKAPGASAGSLFWSAYHPVPRGSIYTFRDEQNRVMTEMAAGTSGSSTATLSVTRDNVFLGNLLVASYVASPAGWQYTTSDHLGSPRVVFNQSGQLVETHKHWPYGEDTNAVPPAQRLAYCLMEKDDGAARYYDHARTHDHAAGRFLSPDSVGGDPRNPQSWNRYTYTLGNPMKHIDPNGLLTILVHGTFARGSSTFLPGGHLFSAVASTFHDRTVSFQWSGRNSSGARSTAARQLTNLVRSYKFAPGEQLNIVAHSHGGNVGIQAINNHLGRPVDNLVTLGTPSLAGYRLSDPGSVKNFVAVSNSTDAVQVVGGRSAYIPLVGETGPAGREQPGAINVIASGPEGPIEAHGQLHESDFLWRFISGLILQPGQERDQLQQQTAHP